MLVVKKGSVTHNGCIYIKGEILPGMKKAEGQRLINMGICVEVPEAKKEKQTALNNQPPQESSNDPNGINIEFDPDDIIKGKAKP